MDIRKEFDSQWYGIRGAVLSEALTQLNTMRCINAYKLTETLMKETSKWERGILVQGVLFEEMKMRDYESAMVFAKTARELKFDESVNQGLPSVWYLTPIIGILAVVLFVVLHFNTQLSLLEQVFYPVLTFSILITIVAPIKQKIRSAAKNTILAYLDKQLEKMHIKLKANLLNINNYDSM